MKLGMFMMPLHPVGRSMTDSYEEDFQTILHADRAGFDEFWLGEHMSCSAEPIPSPLVFLASAIHKTERIKLGLGVLNLPQHHPARVACEVAQFDHMSRGRLLMGIGPGGLLSDFELFKTEDAQQRTEMMLESVHTVLELWRQDPPYRVTGKYWDIDLSRMVVPEFGLGVIPKPFQTPHPQVCLSAMSPFSASVRTAGKHGWSPISAPFIPTYSVKSHWDMYLEGCAAAGRDGDGADWRVARSIFVAPTDSEARDYVYEDPDSPVFAYFDYLLNVMKRFGMTKIIKADPETPDDRYSTRAAIDDVVITGSPRSVADQIIAFRNEVGPFGTIIMAAFDWAGSDRIKRSMQLMADEVMPIIRKSTGSARAAE